ncbi:unknown [Eubacterium sp. CAG:841]|nr:unknown [Eubacterium sp. CAG:841]
MLDSVLGFGCGFVCLPYEGMLRFVQIFGAGLVFAGVPVIRFVKKPFFRVRLVLVRCRGLLIFSLEFYVARRHYEYHGCRRGVVKSDALCLPFGECLSCRSGIGFHCHVLAGNDSCHSVSGEVNRLAADNVYRIVDKRRLGFRSHCLAAFVAFGVLFALNSDVRVNIGYPRSLVVLAVCLVSADGAFMIMLSGGVIVCPDAKGMLLRFRFSAEAGSLMVAFGYLGRSPFAEFVCVDRYRAEFDKR